jgi:trimethylamine--corrinoid protein Co-methyltransferase
VVYGATGTSMDMRSGAYLTAQPEFSMAAGLGAQVARFYDIPCRGGGAVTDSHLPDIQAGMESALTLAAAIDSGINVILLACGMLGTLMAMSFEKFITDETLCSLLKFMTKAITISDETIDLKSIFEVGAGGAYITHPQTFLHCRTAFYQSALINSTEYNDWCRMGRRRMEDAAAVTLSERFDLYKHPEMDSGVKKALERYIDKNK